MGMDFLNRLESLNLNLRGIGKEHLEFQFPLNLEMLTLKLSCWDVISTLRKLPNLKVLTLIYPYDVDEEWHTEDEGDFPNLEFLKLQEVDVVRWTSSGDNLPCLEKLVPVSCTGLIELPACLGYSSTLEVIELIHCWDSVINLAREIEEEQRSMGNEDLKIIVR